ncbi:uncharacterized protein DUF4153 [Paenibacillus cellulosilyticus]|uniref:Uncharacterized protein DUF4153 n=1 Tax=Paenibacillus cellulosilyticus TaxID=375489 RepID=A0A2V2YVF4_9BACL|nr:DUF4153 domain-containing protein [Paenibacillus cellulosilyticus]PWW05079.1 uncharacterized protein DUF4153 [Paenibacillus cellulosilyticus]
MNVNNRVLEQLHNPRELEQMFRADPEAFRQSFAHAWEHNPDSQVLAVWNERLHYKEPEAAKKATLFQRNFVSMGILAILAGICTRLILFFANRGDITMMNIAFGVLPFIAAYFAVNNGANKRMIYTLASIFALAIVLLNLLPQKETDSIVLAYLHLPIFLWVIVGLAYTGNEYRIGRARLAYLKFNGEFAILYACMAISGMLLTGITMRLFELVDLDISEFYFTNIVAFGAAALSVVAAYLVSKNLKLAKNIAPYIARIFSPLVLVTLAAYLVTVAWVGKSPFSDRDFLLSFNGILLGVLAVTIFSITERGTDERKNITDYVNAALIALALIIDSVALSAIVFRLSSYGVTANRLAVLGINVLIWANLIWIMSAYVRMLRNQTGPSTVQDAVTKYLPIYGLWAAFVAVAFPLMF